MEKYSFHELREIGEASLALNVLMHAKLAKKEAKTLAKLKSKLAPLAAEVQTQNNSKDAMLQQNLPLLHPLEEHYNPPEFPPVAALNGLIRKCSKPFEKQLTESDVRDDQCRLSINKHYVKNFITPLLNDDDDLVKGIPVFTYDLSGNRYSMTFKIWASKLNVLTGEWKLFYEDHKFVALQDYVTVWAFRHVENGKLCFVISGRRVPNYNPCTRRRVIRQK